MGADDSTTYSASGTEEYSGDGQYSATTSWNNDTANGWDQQVPTHWDNSTPPMTPMPMALTAAPPEVKWTYTPPQVALLHPTLTSTPMHCSPIGSSEYGATNESGYYRALFDYSADDPEGGAVVMMLLRLL
ncbi:hypothetical protein BV898_14229 [Hypsibius exemplaris]|uniref:Uncharacterized protein n=1 Tax=Hypsibius exemplaris TaxID=2072580 RepID=A0A1W0W8B7_HYPEX|nr:hypothetical protein BV898_14229 [Hypsibius exemplaris]